MRRRLRRFAAVGVVVTVVDGCVLLLLRLGPGAPVIVADTVSVGLASLLSYSLHRSVTFADDPERRWIHSTRLFLVTAIAALVVDVVVLRGAVAVVGSTSAADLLLGKAMSLAAAALVRVTFYRRWLSSSVRREQARPVPRPFPTDGPRLSVVVPAFCEEGRIGGAVARLREALPGAELVVVDDGSADATAAEARAAGADVVVEQTPNRGKGAAVRAGVLASHGGVVAFTDADLSYPPAQIGRLLAAVEEGWDVVVGSRKHVHTTTLVAAGRLRELSGRVFNVLTELVLLGQYRDTQCGLKAFRGDVARDLVFPLTRIDRFAFDVELFHLAERYRLSVLEVPVEVANASASTVHVGRDALRMVRDLFRIRRWSGQGAYDVNARSVRPART